MTRVFNSTSRIRKAGRRSSVEGVAGAVLNSKKLSECRPAASKFICGSGWHRLAVVSAYIEPAASTKRQVPVQFALSYLFLRQFEKELLQVGIAALLLPQLGERAQEDQLPMLKDTDAVGEFLGHT